MSVVWHDIAFDQPDFFSGYTEVDPSQSSFRVTLVYGVVSIQSGFNLQTCMIPLHSESSIL